MCSRSPLTVAGAAPDQGLQACTGFPFHPDRVRSAENAQNDLIAFQSTRLFPEPSDSSYPELGPRTSGAATFTPGFRRAAVKMPGAGPGFPHPETCRDRCGQARDQAWLVNTTNRLAA